jgi:leucyl/phenylalanyl-tRNA---protein transferase
MLPPRIKRTLKHIAPRPVWRSMRHLDGALLGGTQRLLSWPWGWLPEGFEGGAMCRLFEKQELTPELMVLGYHQGMFALSLLSTGAIRWHDPDVRSILPFDQLHVTRRLQRMIRQNRFEVRFNTDFRGVIAGCAESKEGREVTWLTPEHIDLRVELHKMGFAHSFEAWREGKLVGGGYGVSCGGCFFTESLFYRESHASKVSFVLLVEKLQKDGFSLLDLGWPTPHFRGFGSIVMPRREFKEHLARALSKPAEFTPVE